MPNAKDYRKLILDKLKEVLQKKQFKKNGNVFSFTNGDLTYFIGVQSSQSSTSLNLILTLNIEIASALLSKLDDVSIPIQHQRHYNKRIGFYLDKPEDKWWTMNSLASAELAAYDILAIINERVLRELESIQTTGDLANIWRGNGFKGTTEGQRKKFLALLTKHGL